MNKAVDFVQAKIDEFGWRVFGEGNVPDETKLLEKRDREKTIITKEFTSNPFQDDGKLKPNIKYAAGKSASNDDKSEKIGFFKQILTDYYKVKTMQTQVQIDLADRAWEWLGRKVKYAKEKISSKIQFKREETDFLKALKANSDNEKNKYIQLNARFERVKNVKYSNDTTKIEYDSNYKPLESTSYLNCIGFVCYMYNISASYSVSNFDKYTQFSELKNIKKLNQLQIGDIITWEYESGKVDKNNKPIYEYHASIWKGNGEIWECMDPNGVRTRNYQKYYDYMNSPDMKIKTVKYFRLKEGNK